MNFQMKKPTAVVTQRPYDPRYHALRWSHIRLFFSLFLSPSLTPVKCWEVASGVVAAATMHTGLLVGAGMGLGWWLGSVAVDPICGASRPDPTWTCPNPKCNRSHSVYFTLLAYARDEIPENNPTTRPLSFPIPKLFPIPKSPVPNSRI